MRLVRDGSLTVLGKVLVVLTATWAFAVIVPDIYRVVVPFWTLGFSADEDGNVTQVTDPRAAPLAPSDRIDLSAMKCAPAIFSAPCGDLMAIVGGMGGLTYVTPGHPPLHLVVIGAKGAERTVTVHPNAGEKTPVWARVVLALDELAGIFFIALALIIVWEAPSRMTAGFFLFAMWFNPGQYFVFYALLQPYPIAVLIQEVLQSVVQAAGYAGLLVFAIRFPQNSVPPRWSRIETPLAGGAALVVLALQLWSFDDAFGGTAHVSLSFVTTAAFYVGYAIDVIVIAILFSRLRGQPGQVRQRIRWVAWGSAIGLTAFIFADSNEATTMWNGLWSIPALAAFPAHQAAFEGFLDLFYALNVTVAVAIFYAVRHHRVVNVNFALSRAATLLTLWIVEGIALAALTLAIEHLVHELQYAIFAAVIVLLTLTFEWLHERINEGCDRLFFPQIHHAQAYFEQIAPQLANADAFETVDRLLTESPVQALSVASSAVFRTEGGGPFQRRGGFGWDERTADHLERDGALAMHASSCKAPFRLQDVGPCEDIFPHEIGRPTVAIPIWAHGELLSIALCGPHTSGDDLNVDELGILRDFAANVSRSYDRAEITTLRGKLSRLGHGVPITAP